jgi:hypothetical protein
MAKCSIVECSVSSVARGLCQRHYKQLPDRKEAFAKYKATNKEKRRAGNKKWYAKNKERAKQTGKRWDTANADRVASNKAAWRKANPDYGKRRSRMVSARFSRGKSKAKQRGLAWEISLIEFESLSRAACSYCQFALPETGIGLDRIDNAVGYSLENVVPCCTECNLARNALFTHSEMLGIIGPAIREVRLTRGSSS